MNIGVFYDRIDVAVENGEVTSVSNALETLAALGLSYVDASSGLFIEKYSPEELYEILEESGITCGSMFHLSPFSYTDKNILSKKREDTLYQLEKCKKIKSELFMPVPLITEDYKTENDRIECRKVIVEYFKDVCELANQFDIKVNVENFSNRKNPFSKIEDIEFILNNIPQIYYALDTGNYIYGEDNVLEATEKFAQKTEHIHFKDIVVKNTDEKNSISQNFESVILGDGEIPLKEIVEIMRSANYDKNISIEINHNENLMHKTIQSLNFVKSIL